MRQAHITNHAADVFVATLLAYVFISRRVIAGFSEKPRCAGRNIFEAIMLSLIKDSGPIVPSGAKIY